MQQMGKALSHPVSCPFLFCRTWLHCPQQPGMGNGVKEGAVRLREDADTVLPSSVPSKASTCPHAFSWSLSCGFAPITDHPLHWCGAASVWGGGDAGYPICDVNPAPNHLARAKTLPKFGCNVRSCPGAHLLSQICKHKRIGKLGLICEEGPSRPILALRAGLKVYKLKG